ncbi:hypothetical protein C8J57DRAFT_1724143 [Mycena rebaudengoi]|nr:hypothetical protein C8J57DRAFT_1724143 [Mycena rebaudengoi]
MSASSCSSLLPRQCVRAPADLHDREGPALISYGHLPAIPPSPSALPLPTTPFSADELLLFGNSEEDWTTETLSEALKADHGFNGETRAICDLVEILSEYDPMTRNYLQFMTGVQGKLPLILRS